MVQSFGTAAARVKELGFEGVEIHGGHGYLIHEFLSAASNKRTDEYGGSFDNRLRFLLEVVESVRSSVGPDFTVGFRLSGDEFVDGGTSLEHQAAVAGRVASLGLADYVSQTAGAYRSMERIVLPPTFGQGAHLHLSRAIKEAVGSLPLMVVGRIFEPEYANQIVRDGVGDMVVMTRALIADPQLPKKARESHSGRVRHCVGAMECWARTRKDFPVSCSVNPRAGRESQKLLEKTAYPSTIAVVGAGPGGAEVAIRLGATGHRVVLFDKASETGGRLNLASRASILAQWGRLVDDQRDDLAHSKNVQLALGTEASVDSLRDLGPAAIVVAAGARPRCPEVMDSGGTLNVDEALANPSGVGCRVLVYCETRHMAPLAVAHALANSDRSVTIVSPHAQVGAALDPNSYADVRRRLAVAKVSILPELLLHHVDGDAAYFNEVWPNWPAEQGVPTREIAFDTLIYDVGDMPYDDLYFKLSAAGFLAFRVGDCLTPRNVIGATRDASDLPLVLEGRLARQSTS
jgi:2,4-dienoyl-CoA reductase (NADPH2)